MDKPMIGRIVHFVCPTTLKHRAAIVNAVWCDDGDCEQGTTEADLMTVGLTVFRDAVCVAEGAEPIYVIDGVNYCPEHTPKTWHWPERN